MPLSVPNILRRAEYLLLHPDELLHTLGQALRKAYDQRKILIHVFEDFILLFRLVKTWGTGEYKVATRTTILWAVIAILYFLSPLDLIPDIFPGGYIDDIFVINWVVKHIQIDLDKFRAWQKGRK